MRRALLAAVFLVGCSSVTGSIPSRVTQAFDKHPPRSVVVSPPSNKSSDVEATAVVQKLLERALERRGYHVGGAADATLHSVIERYGSQPQPLSGESRLGVRVSAKLYDNASGALLWSGEEAAYEEVENDESKHRDFIDDFMEFGLDEPSEPVARGKAELAKEAVGFLLVTLPKAPGK